MSVPGRCRACGSNFTGKSRDEYRDAPGWKDECPACTKKKFVGYVREYAVKVLSPRGMVEATRMYYGERFGDLPGAESVDRVTTRVADMVFTKQPPRKSNDPETIGLSIAKFVKHVDDIIETHDLQPSRLDGRRGVQLVFVIGLALLSLAILLIFLP